MPSINKPILRLAVAIHAELTSHRAREPLIELPAVAWQRCAELVRQIRRSQLRGWQLAAKTLLGDLSYTIPSVQNELTALQQRLPRNAGRECLATASDIYQDLVALDLEFEELNYDCQARRLSVTTGPITLNGIYLGPFEIQLQWARQTSGEASAYRVIAKDPHPAESRDNVTHPHVMDEILCEGDGRHAIRQALSQGRLLDFFTLVAGILRTYNPESPFVELAIWSGSSCSDCGAVVSEDESYSCQRCGDLVCSECERVCRGCEDSYCSGCTSLCPACDETYCGRCLSPCNDCQVRFCSSCLDEYERCPNCHEDESIEDGTAADAASPDSAAVQPDGLGQTLVST